MIEYLQRLDIKQRAHLISIAVIALILLLFGTVLLSTLRMQSQDRQQQLSMLAQSLHANLLRWQQRLQSDAELMSRNGAIVDRLFYAAMEENTHTEALPPRLELQLGHDLLRLFDFHGATISRQGAGGDIVPAAWKNRSMHGFLHTDTGPLYLVQMPVLSDSQLVGYIAIGNYLNRTLLQEMLGTNADNFSLQYTPGETPTTPHKSTQQIRLGEDDRGQPVVLTLRAIHHHNAYGFFIWLGVGLLMAILLWWWLYDRLLGDIILRLSSSQQRLEAMHAGDLYPEPASRNDAVGKLEYALHDMSRRLQQKTNRLQQQSETLQLVTDTAPIWIWQCDPSGHLTFMNRQMRQDLQLEQLPSGNTISELLNLDGDQQSIELSGRHGDSEGLCKMHICKRTLDMHLIVASQQSSAGELIRTIGVAVDMTEYRKLEANYLQAQKMESLGTLVGGVAHNFNNMLAGMVGHIYLARKSVQNPQVLENHLAKLLDISDRASGMIKQLLAYAHKGMDLLEYLDMSMLIQDAFDMIRPSIPANIRFTFDVQKQGVQVHGNASALQQVFVNMVVNARDALAEKQSDKQIAVRLKCVSIDAQMRKNHPAITGEEAACLTIKDNGQGMSDTVLEHIFEPFYTTKDVDKGTGLGLSMSVGTVESYGGWIDVDSTPGEGTEFSIYLPVQKPTTTTQAVSQELPAASGYGQGILLVEDEPLLIDVGKSILESLGYRVLTADHGRTALDVFFHHRTDIQLVMTDVIMPEMGGVELYRELQRIAPDVPVIFVSGYSDDELALSHQRVDGAAILHKPYSIYQVSELLSAML